jgi:hypothetical protein
LLAVKTSVPLPTLVSPPLLLPLSGEAKVTFWPFVSIVIAAVLATILAE